MERSGNARASDDRPAAAWVLNLEAEHELEARGAFTPSAHLRAIVERERGRLLGALVAPGDLVLTDGGVARVAGDNGAPRLIPASEMDAHGLEGRAWSPTPSALARLRSAGAVVPRAPSVDALRAVNARPFAARVRTPLAGASFAKSVATDLDRALALVARPAADGWLVRRTFGAAGRGRRRIAAGRPTADERAWLVASLRLGPLVVEPWVRVTREHTRSGWVAPDGAIAISGPCLQRTTSDGAWLDTARASSIDEVGRDDDRALAAAFEAAGKALAEAGYFGPFGVDAFHHRGADGREVLNPLGEINARFTMDWATAMDAERPPSPG